MLFVAIISLLFYDINTVAGNSVTVHLDAKWSNTPLIAEAGEYFAAESADLFWKYTQHLSEIQDKLSVEQDDLHNHELITKIAKKLLISGQISVLQLSLATRLYSSAVEMNHQLDTDLSCEQSSTFSRVLDQSFCDLKELMDFISNYKGDKHNPVIYKTDKIYPGIESLADLVKDRLVVILYGDLQDIHFYTWHLAIVEKANKNEIYYVFRHRIKNRSEKKTRLSGYGVELAIKSTEYKAVDDTRPPVSNQDDFSDVKISSGADNNENVTGNTEDEVQGFIFSKLKELHPALIDDLDIFKQHLLKSDLSEIKPMKAWQIQELSLKAGQLVMNSLVNNEALETLRDISQNFPVRAHHLSEVPVTQDFKNELLVNQAVLEQSYGLQPGQSLVTFNGFALSQDLDVYEILDLARREMGVMTRLHNFGLQGDHISSLMNVQHSSSDNSNAGSQFLLDIRRAPITYINNLEKDRRYSSWPKSVNDLLTPTYPGMMRRVAKNLFNTIIVLDPVLPESRDFVKFAEAFIVHNAPIRIGFLWSVDPTMDLDNSPGRALIRAFNFVSSENDNSLSGLSFITDFYSSVEDNEVITVPMVKAFLKKKHPDYDMEITFGENSDYDNNVKASWKYLHESGIINLPKPFLLINGLLIDSKTLTESGFEEIIVSNVLQSTGELQKLVVDHKLIDGIPILDLLLSGDNVVNRLNNKILQNSNMRYISFTKSMDFNKNITIDSVKGMNEDQLSTFIADNTNYFVKNDDYNSIKSSTIWIVTDVETEEGKMLLHESMRWVQMSHISRVALVQNPSIENKHSPLNKIIYNIIHKLSADISRSIIVSLLTDNSGLSTGEIVNKIINENKNVKELLGNVDEVLENYLMVEDYFVKNVLKGMPGESFVITNGKVYSTFSLNETFIKDDYKLIEQGCSGASRLLNKLKDILGSGINKAKLLSDLTNKVHATLQKDLAKSSTSAQIGIMSNSKKIEIKGLIEEFTGFTLMGHISKPAFDLVAIIDPLSRISQKLSQIMIVLKEALNLNVRVIFNCKDKLSETPLKSFYRFVLDSSPVTKDANGNSISMSNPKAQFTRLPGQPLLTLGLEPIHNWLVEATKSVYDLDNIRLSEVKNGMVLAYFELEYLLLEGHCVDLTTGQPPRGLQFVLSGNDAQKTTHDTIVMANLGYFQLKANPGAWNLRLRDGKSKDIYDIIDHEYTDSEEKSPDVVAVLNSFRAKIIRVKVNKKANKINENVLSESKLDEETNSIWASISSAFSNKKSDSKNETINIFSVASGHLYERFLRLMMLSVTKHTKSKVKFWFLKNFLSPTFKQFIPHMAKKYGFEYDLVQYKWPRWLHQQTEKQRIIWGYKILFLDVLFPLNVSKIIFVDADQTVRADLQELVDLDLEGAPYGYTPFCNSRKEMDGFRFWKSGYWSQHLAGRPYHISALYVVDLNRFRLMAAGDRLRGQYHGLSQDPNSLSNLDQDLPNNMIHQVPIKSLPQEWLWCETWCSEDEKKKAKTIDLCNNPMTKEPKLTAAARIVPEWKEYDEEIKALWNEVYSLKPHIPRVITSNDPHTVIPEPPKTEL